MISGISVNFVAVIVSAVVAMAIGFAYYSPFILGKPWMAASGLTPKKLEQMKKQKNMGAVYGLSFVGSLVCAFVLAGFLKLASAQTISDGFFIGFLAWLGFSATTMFTDALFGDKGLKLFFINTLYQALCFVAMGAILVAWP